MSTFDIEQERKHIEESSSFLRNLLNNAKKEHIDLVFPTVLIICGSGLGGIASRISEDSYSIPQSYSEIPHFKVSTVPGHAGKFVFGKMNGTSVVLMEGRLHSYEGYAIQDTVFPLRVLHELGSIKTVIITNAAGGLNRKFQACDLMCINDHINFPGLAGLHPLKGPNFDEYGPRFLPLSDAYDLELRKLLFRKMKELDLKRGLHEGTYAFASGPTFESRAESRMLHLLGADAVGMSTVPEVIVARHCGWRVLALSLITNVSVLDPPASALDDNPIPLDQGMASHSEVLENGKIASLDVERLIEGVVGEL
ncbi:similar to Saccharomyces cerevisiae YLR209C PNP1 Purine nucleoside phosphorylase, specifically metabolizes inosine and guanosine nucleosides [Maudiozyma barnettii]|uniref:Purine nucleoside phosphorylase n=1 Tax=Maudiozyma barnettii TaxID=61262 RepID=A0A8H2ZGX2_9SACH|nr:purine-nucleoside phosphorylase [Kazachstania barnettii]CAB4253967.1 similar to Saccharomyces cerevisiae YLR209C PNP1 Purine nucleoside phosphorylase, specifically metabolizes inosine and guanosine nucleosides [Kazachstania barnettii]CAD1781717.1 similar to Saccharomyces cerevisiae YLR209C PNP1 Purine nucleoside phosphorylase, specifically metabolizes inosine and guanosine nucleosides [Kazachstania barnettii]